MESSPQRRQKRHRRQPGKIWLALAFGFILFLKPLCALGSEADVMANLEKLEILANKDPRRAQEAIEAVWKELDRASQPRAWLYAARSPRKLPL